MSAITTAVSGLNAAVAKLNVSASTIASASTGFGGSGAPSTGAISAAATASASSAPAITPAPAQLSTGTGGDLGTALVSQIDALTQFKANLSVLKTSDEMTRSLLDLKA